ncbi:MAG: universal stress protein, partial [Planctomycetaceae bacterium]|nr:universal stress protein [Planctomycetaceae bacterium]
MIKLKRILAATDFSDCSEHALRYACEFADVFGAELHLVYVNEPPAAAYSEFGIGLLGVQGIEEDIKRGAEARLNAMPGL